MRETDFHPVSRTVQFRDKDKIEVAELSYEILPWRDAQFAQASSDSEAAVILTEISKSLEHLEEAARQNSPAENPAPSSLSSNAQDKK